MSAELFIYAAAAIALALMLYLGLQSEETVRAWDQRAKERARNGGLGRRLAYRLAAAVFIIAGVVAAILAVAVVRQVFVF